MRRAIAKLRKERMTISTPKSILKTFLALYGEDHGKIGKHTADDDDWAAGAMTPAEAEEYAKKAHGLA